MKITERFIENIRKEKLFLHNDPLLLAVSGGADSVVLCELCKQAGYSFVIAHMNFGLRAGESERDEQFVRKLAEKYEVPVYVKHVDTVAYATGNKISIQVAARELRYDWFNDLLSSNESPGVPKPRWLLTAHHADDNIETMLMNFFRGTGISGLRGILPRQEKIIRPLLPFRKEELLHFAAENKLEWVEDSSNASDKYSRNYFRHVLLPVVNKVFPEAENNLIDNLQRFRDIETLYNQAVSRQTKKLLEKKGNEIHVPVLALKNAVPLHTLVYEIIRPYQFSSRQVDEVIRLLDGEQGKYVQSPTHRIIRNRNWLIIASNDPRQSVHILIEEGEKQVQFEKGTLAFDSRSVAGVKVTPDSGTAVLDIRHIVFPLILRKWKQGDYFYPLGMAKKKKIARFLIDQKLSPTQKENTWVLESDKKILWVVGLRIDDRFKITDKTRESLTISYQNNIERL